ncbi:MAG: glycosyltransferase family 2 protein [Deltaproteobacteria bacterium]|nr:glycosyltransferase family 2 protein [Deltaproteobacteria bacterium]
MPVLDLRLSVVIPAYNEARRLPNTLREVSAYLGRQSFASEIVVVDDGSTDETAQIVRDWPAAPVALRLVSHSDGRNHGKGAAVRLGFREATGRVRVFMDADNSTTIDHIERFWPYFDQGYDAVIGSRDVSGANVVIPQAWYKELGGKVGNLIIRLLAVPGIFDTQAGFKAFSARCLEEILPRMTIDRWGFDVELLVAARCRGFKVKEVPIIWRNDSASSVPATAYLQVLGEVWRVRKQRAAGWYVR